MRRFLCCFAVAIASFSAISASAQTIVGPGVYLPVDSSNTAYIVQSRGILEVRPGATPQSGKITLARGFVAPYSHVQAPVTLTGPIEVQGFGLIGLSSGSSGTPASFQGPITGWGTLGFQSGPHNFQGAIDFTGDLMFNERANTVFSGAVHVAGDYLLEPHPTDTTTAFATWKDNAPVIDGHAFVLGGELRVQVDSTINQLVIDHRRQIRTPNMNAIVDIQQGKTLDVLGDVAFRGGEIRGDLRFQGDLVKEMRTLGALSGLGSDFDNDIIVNEGMLNVVDSMGTGSTVGVVRIARTNAAMTISKNTVVADDVYLNNSQGFRYTGALLGNNISEGTTPELAGDLYLGDQGSYLGGLETSNVNGRDHGGSLVISGAIHGGALNKSTRGPVLAIVGDGHTYTGPTNVLGDTLALRGAGRLESTSAVVLRSASPQLPVLQFDNTTTTHPDRLADNVPIETLGGRIEILGGTTETAHETLGNVHVKAGTLYLSASGQSTLTINNLTRQPDTTVMFVRSGTGSQFQLPNATLNNGLLGGWAVVSTQPGGPADDFATIGPGGVVGLASVQPYHTDPNMAGPTDNLKLTAVNFAYSIPSSKHVNAVRFESSATATLDLRGHTLTLESGGMLGAGPEVTVQNGNITAGAAQNLYLHRGFDIKAAIVDGASGPLSVVVNNQVSLSGNNSYTGATVVNTNGWLMLESRSAMPANTDLVMNGGRFRNVTQDGLPLEFNKVVLRSGVIDYESHPSYVPLVASEYEVYSGDIVLPLGGSGKFYKRGEGIVTLAGASTYTGQIVIEQGTLDVGGSLGGGFPSAATATLVKQGGILVSRGSQQEYVILEGGTLAGSIQDQQRFEGPIEVRAASRIETATRGSSFVVAGPILGSHDLTVEGGLNDNGGTLTLRSSLNQFQGNIKLTGGAILMDTPNINYGGTISIDAYDLRLRHHDALGRGITTVLPAGAITLEDLTTPLNSKLKVQGKLRLLDNATTINSDIRFEGRPEIDGFGEFVNNSNFAPTLQFNAPATFADGTRFISRGRTNISFAGNVILEGATELVAHDGFINIVNKVVATAPNSSLNLIGRQPDANLGTVELLPGAGFSLYHNSLPLLSQFQSPSAKVAGNGTIGTPVAVGNNATVSPGASIGQLHFASSLTLNTNANYEWEISDALGQPGQASGWDHIVVDGLLDIVTGAQNFITIRIIGLGGDGKAGQIANFDPLEDYSWPIISADDINGFSPSKFRFNLDGFTTHNPLPTGATFRVEQDLDGLSLVYQVPAPPALLLSAQAGLLLLAGLRRRSSRKSRRC